MAYTLSNKYAKNVCKRTVLLQLIIKTWSHVFLEHSVLPSNFYLNFKHYSSIKNFTKKLKIFLRSCNTFLIILMYCNDKSHAAFIDPERMKG